MFRGYGPGWTRVPRPCGRQIRIHAGPGFDDTGTRDDLVVFGRARCDCRWADSAASSVTFFAEIVDGQGTFDVESADHLFDVLREDVALEVDFVSGLSHVEIGVAVSMRNDRH